jgi:hypothetical protein
MIGQRMQNKPLDGNVEVGNVVQAKVDKLLQLVLGVVGLQTLQ